VQARRRAVPRLHPRDDLASAHPFAAFYCGVDWLHADEHALRGRDGDYTAINHPPAKTDGPTGGATMSLSSAAKSSPRCPAPQGVRGAVKSRINQVITARGPLPHGLWWRWNEPHEEPLTIRGDHVGKVSWFPVAACVRAVFSWRRFCRQGLGTPALKGSPSA